MTTRILLIVALLLPLAVGLTPPRSCAEELTLAEIEELLGKAQAALLWFREIGTELDQRRISPATYHEKITPVELIQVVSLLHSFHEAEQTALAERLLMIFPLYRLTPEESFEVYDIVGNTMLFELGDISTEALMQLPTDADYFRTRQLNSAEQVVLYQEPATSLDVMQAVDILSVVGRPVLVRHYLRKYLAGTPATTPEEAATIVETLGTQKLLQLAAHPDFVPLGKEVVAKIIDEAKKHWQDEERIAEALKEITDDRREPATASPSGDTVPDSRALSVLWKGDQLSVQQVFDKLATLEDEKEADQLTAILLSLRPDMKEVLAAAVYSTNPKLRYHAARGLAVSVTPQESFLLYPFLFIDNKGFDMSINMSGVIDNSGIDRFRRLSEPEKETVKNILQRRRIAIPSQEQAATILHERGKDYFERRRPLRTDADGNVPFWILVPDEEEGGDKILYWSKYDIETAYRYFAHKYYSQSFLIVPVASANYEVYGLMNDIAHPEYYGHRYPIYGHNLTGIRLSSLANVNNEQLLQASLERDCCHAARFAIVSMQRLGQASVPTGRNVYNPRLQPGEAGTPNTIAPTGRNSSDSVSPRQGEQEAGDTSPPVDTGGYRHFAPSEQAVSFADFLQSTNSKPRTLVQATASKNRDVRFAALETIMSLNPTEPFAGSSLVADALVWFSKSDGERVALSGHPQMAVANQTASLLLGGGYKTDVAVSCRELFQKAAASPDVELIFVDARTPSPPVGEFVQRMRQDTRTAEIPIAILGGDERDLNPNIPRRNEMTQFDRRSPDAPFRTSLSLTYPRVADEKSALWVVDDLLDKTGSPHPNPPPEGEGTFESPLLGERARVRGQRLEQAKQALGWLREIKFAELESGQKIYHFDDFDAVVLNALHSERRVIEGLELAAVVKSVAVQSAIYDLAANAVYPLALRNQAGDAFIESVERFGILLRGTQIQRLYDRYNQSEHESKESQELLGRLLDVVEAKAGK